MQYEDREDYKEAMARITKRMADQVDKELLERLSAKLSGKTLTVSTPINGIMYDYMYFDEAPPYEVKEWPSLEEKVRDPKLERTLQAAHTRAKLQRNRPEMKRLEQQMKRNRC